MALLAAEIAPSVADRAGIHRPATFQGKCMNVLVLNSGSSSLKFQLITTDLGRIAQNKDDRLCRGHIEGIGGEAIITILARASSKRKFSFALPNLAAALEYVIKWMASDAWGIAEVRSLEDIQAVGHRVVH